jgi:ABC-type multidrug transport system fused ATPase/permease subunit
MSDVGQNPLTIKRLLRPHLKALSLGVLVVAGGSVADLLQPWPLKVIIDTVLKARTTKTWLNGVVVGLAGNDPLAILRLAALAVLGIAALGASCSYAEKSLTTTVGQKVLHEMRRTLFAQIQRLSLAYRDRQQTGDLISRVTGDIDSVQTFLASGLPGALVSSVRHDRRDVLHRLEVHADRAFDHAVAVRGGVHLHAQDQESLAGGAQERRRDGFHHPGGLFRRARGEGLRARRL